MSQPLAASLLVVLLPALAAADPKEDLLAAARRGDA